MESIKLNSAAKINFGLNIVSKRPDGFHNIETVFYPVQLHDELLINRSDKFSFKCSDKNLGSEKDNLIIKSKNLLEEHLNKIFKIEIVLEKNIPVGAGLGGGSSNAAASLLALNVLFNLKLPEDKLNEIALNLGSDVPFFLDPKPMFAKGRGEKLSPVNFKIKKPLLIINPGIYISTPWAYSKINPKKPANCINAVIEDGNEDFSRFKGVVTNDFEEIVFKEYPQIGQIKNDLYKLGAEFALMTGSGSTLFGIFSNLDNAIKAEKTFREKYFTFIHFEN